MIELKKFLNIFKLNKMYKKKHFLIKLLPKTKPLLLIMVKLNIINFIKIKDYNYHIIFPNLTSNLKIITQSKKGYQYITYNNIEKVLLKKKWTAIISTSKGLKTTKQCVKEKLGGVILCNILCEN